LWCKRSFVGLVEFHLHPRPSRGVVNVFVEIIFVQRKHRGRGAGTRMLETLFSRPFLGEMIEAFGGNLTLGKVYTAFNPTEREDEAAARLFQRFAEKRGYRFYIWDLMTARWKACKHEWEWQKRTAVLKMARGPVDEEENEPAFEDFETCRSCAEMTINFDHNDDGYHPDVSDEDTPPEVDRDKHGRFYPSTAAYKEAMEERRR